MINLYNTLARKKQTFKPLRGKNVGIYTCGPTVYNFAHLGNLRTYIFEDILRRVLKYNSYKVKQIMNITDVEDKIIKKAQQEKKNINQITKPYAKIFLEDLKKLSIEKAEKYPLATKHIKEMIALISGLIKKGIAYKGEDGSIYFNIQKFKNYGKLSQLQKREIKIGARVSADEYNKEQAQDFVLWKTKKLNEPFWKSPFGDGRPGWHIECSAMAMKYLGKTFDIHAGGVDLIFPHHENEIAQSEAATGKKFVNYWLHGEHLLVNNEKMSKSLGNIYTLRDLEQKNFNPLAFRYLVLTSHYRSKLNFTWESLQAAQNALNNLHNEMIIINADKKSASISENQRKLAYEKQFLDAINDDLNTPKAIALVRKIVKDKNLSSNAKKSLVLKLDKALGLGLKNVKSEKIPLKIKQMADERDKLRANKQFIPADLLRKKIEELGYIVEDTAAGPKILRK
ncbi:MAG: cysteine--tRNA ligase [Patescibacteria group bacterium]|nr:cysteine--tRNA ligase [Patescibacteria group bacterium]